MKYARVNERKVKRKAQREEEMEDEERLICWEYRAACGPCGTISPRSARLRYISLRRADRVRKVNRASETRRKGYINYKENKKRFWKNVNEVRKRKLYDDL